MNWKTTNRIVASAVFLFALVLYLLTMAPTVSFWDSGEFIASVHGLQVMHPPGAPFYMLLGRLFSMFMPAEYVALSVNLISVLASAATILFTYLIIVHLTRLWQGNPETPTTGHYVVRASAGVIGAVTFAATDSFWFNAVEAEVYALSMFFTATVVWLIMKWSDQAQREEELLSGNKHHPFRLDANRYLVLIAYLFGLAIGVHLLNLLAMFFIALIVFFTEFDRPDWTTTQRWKGIVLTGLISAVAFFTVYPGIIVGLPSLADQSGTPLFLFLIVVAAVTYGVYYTHTRRMPAANIVTMCFAVVLIGYSSYALIFIRSQAEPPIDLMDPDTEESFVSYLKREQYGSTPLLRGATFNDQSGQVNPQAEESLFPRRYSTNPQHWRVYERYSSDLSFFLDYQIGHMYVRYFLWNFAGRASDVQDAPAVTGLPGIDPASTASSEATMQTPSEEASRNVYFALPLLLGLLGAFFHFSYDWRRAFSVFILFFVTGIGIIIYLNQTPMQPRERDYSYVASFFAFSMWVGIGAAGLLQLAYESLQDRLRGASLHGSVLGAAALLFLMVPAWMIGQNYDDHDRSGNYVAWDYAHNMLMSLDENAILFTNGDNDTYPLWYLQNVENVRPDVRVVNLSLLNTSWYTEQLMEEQALASEPLPISMTNDRVNSLGYIRWQPRTVQLPVNKDRVAQASEMFVTPRDTSQLESPMSWKLTGRPFSQDLNVLQAADQVAYNILRTNAENGWERPVYFAITVAPSGQLDLQNFFQLEGLTFRVVPVKHSQQMGRVVPEITPARLEQFRFTNLNESGVYFNENTRRMLDAYRNVFSHTAERLAAQGHAQEGKQLIERLMTAMPFSTVAGDARSRILMARAFEAVGDSARVVELMEAAEPLVLGDLRTASSRRNFSFALQYAGMVRMMYQQAGAQESLSAFDNQLETLLAQAPYQLPPDARSAFGLPSAVTDSAGGANLPSNLQPDLPQ